MRKCPNHDAPITNRSGEGAVLFVVALALVILLTSCGTPAAPTAIPVPTPTATPEIVHTTVTLTVYMTPTPTEVQFRERGGMLWCPDCAAANMPVNVWSHWDRSRATVVWRAPHHQRVFVIDEHYHSSERRTYYKVRSLDRGREGWVPETLIRVDPN